MPKKIEVLAREVRLTGVNDQDYVCLTDMPLPCQSSISAAACCSTGSGNTAGPALKLNTLAISYLLPEFEIRKLGN
jgi:phage tail sheath gpL-like